MKILISIDGITLDGFAWSARQRRLFERSLCADLHDAIAGRKRSAGAFVARNLDSEALSIGSTDAGNPELVAQALASPLNALLLDVHQGRSGGALQTRAG